MKLIKGNPVSQGIAIGKIFVYKAFSCDVFETYFEKGQEEKRLLQYEDAMKAAAIELNAVIEKLEKENDDKSKIFEAHLEILEDEVISDEIRASIREELAMPDYAVEKSFSAFAALLGRANDPLIAARAADLRDVRNRLLRILHGEKEKNLSVLNEQVVVVAHDLLPSDTATLDRSKVLGIVTEVGGATSHSAIIARGFGIPAILGVPEATVILRDGEECIVDALEGTVYVRPDTFTLDSFMAKRAVFGEEAKEIAKFIDKEALLKSGEKIMIGLNVGSDEDSDDYRHCDFVGLLRSEFLYMQSDHMPTEEEQYRTYVQVLKNAKGRPVTLRTLDIGGDKTLPYLELPKEDNPFLGNRALRLCLSHPDLFHVQLRAALRASAEGPLWLMFPMVGTMDDIRAARAAVDRAKQELRTEHVPFDENIMIGIMIEIPSIAQIADLAVKEVDFASVGTNDLAQYTHAVDRMNANIAGYYQSFSPSMFRILGHIFSEFNKAGKPISVCGELGGDPLAVVVLAGLGLRKMSMSGSNIARVKRMLSKFTLQEVEEIAETARVLPTQKEILQYLKDKTGEKTGLR